MYVFNKIIVNPQLPKSKQFMVELEYRIFKITKENGQRLMGNSKQKSC